MSCNCASTFQVRLARSNEYKIFKQVLDRGRHPAFIGRSTFGRHAENGGAIIYEHEARPVAVSLINPHLGILLALNVDPGHRAHGLGGAIMKFLMPNFARVLESKIPWFQKKGYKCIGRLKRGQTLNTQVMAREELFLLAGRLQKMLQIRDNTRHRQNGVVK